MVGMGAIVTRDVKPFSKSFGNPCRIQGVNVVGMERFGLSKTEIVQATEYLLQEKKTPKLSENLNSIFQRFASIAESNDDV
jgi:UDP-N-acetylglucosamine acyltransferase